MQPLIQSIQTWIPNSTFSKLFFYALCAAVGLQFAILVGLARYRAGRSASNWQKRLATHHSTPHRRHPAVDDLRFTFDSVGAYCLLRKLAVVWPVIGMITTLLIFAQITASIPADLGPSQLLGYLRPHVPHLLCGLGFGMLMVVATQIQIFYVESLFRKHASAAFNAFQERGDGGVSQNMTEVTARLNAISKSLQNSHEQLSAASNAVVNNFNALAGRITTAFDTVKLEKTLSTANGVVGELKVIASTAQEQVTKFSQNFMAASNSVVADMDAARAAVKGAASASTTQAAAIAEVGPEIRKMTSQLTELLSHLRGQPSGRGGRPTTPPKPPSDLGLPPGILNRDATLATSTLRPSETVLTDPAPPASLSPSATAEDHSLWNTPLLRWFRSKP